MCGIAGIRRFGEEPIRADQIKILGCALQHRGIDATGVAIKTGKDLSVFKTDDPAWRFFSLEKYNEWVNEKLLPETDTVLIHTRAATKGNPSNNANNHPLCLGVTAVVHNGMIWNDDQMFRDSKLKRSGEVDSDIFRAILDEYGLTKKGMEQLKKVSGSAAIAAVSTAYPDKLILARSGSPLVLASTQGQLIWASEKAAIHLACRPFVRRFGIYFQPNRADLAFITMNPDSAWLLGPEGLEWHTEFKTAVSYRPPTYQVHENFQDHQKRFYPGKSKALEVVFCPKCERAHTVPDNLKDVPLADLECAKCHSPMGVAA